MIKIVTHNGSFHTDDVMAVATLTTFFEDKVSIIRTRNHKDFETADYVIDVGEIYDGKKFFDHHMKNGLGMCRNGIDYASAGLIWYHFGKLLIPKFNENLNNSQIDKIFTQIDDEIMKPIDLLDNGEEINLTNILTFSHYISSFNPNWNEEQNFDKLFYKALTICQEFLINTIKSKISSLEAEKIIINAETICEGKVIILEQFCHFQRVIFDNNMTEILFVCFPDNTNNEWKIQAIPPEPKSFKQRKPLPEKWLEKPPVEDFIFCHKGLFIAGAKSKNSIILMAKEACN